ncbi:MAG: phenylalanine--tRNA ligase subunit beta [Deltaproteobacteria bacterium]|jgi:phenylalanyl-tRNA synthetase beta chain|nr:phenylalanine--tRNA ligase subunit beta [Deltaproteobacteria bacterium]MBT4268112.1 phenylalanine--tRNA ligase subunit beta [Deltaproteobacteria bacterium]MBT4640259.1 phenylalanine--tRNA ligase subunit beta [Deltaproteobacteria bacterium]MBT6502955.1 phenylalanine--tRNA ligase subunit beta [Deltaproteobacteria bacterium]MBT6612660.1 phenylalanine--tRNA ligase subunit beta [Deltaproteobacteria bacterium]
MKISLNWIKDFICIEEDLSNQELVEKITLSICEVEGFEETGTHLKETFVSQVLAIEPHPDADKLSLVTINTGKEEKRVVCGASNFKPGDKVPFVGEGAMLPGNFLIKKAKIRGVESDGMLCAEDELGLSEDHDGLLILPEDSNVGDTLATLFPDQVDVVMEIDNKSITHRPDLWGHYGFARELGAVFRVPVDKMDFNPEILEGTGSRLIEVEVLAGDLVPRFTGISVDNVSISPSPLWMQYRLTRVGLRPINNMVDLTNYVMLEMGQPMHAFDADQIAGKKLTVRPADSGTKLMTLHQKEVTLGENDMTICDANGASVVAGVVGGLNTGVIESTNAVFLEAANWDPTGIRKTSTRIGLRTDACQRFEKALDPEMTALAVQRAVELMKLTNPDLHVAGDLVDIQNQMNSPVRIETTIDFICRRLGKDIDEKEIRDILGHLEFTVTGSGSELIVDVPSHRRTKDVSIAEDLVEEIGRIHGFNNITPQAPFFPIQRPAFNRQHQFERKAKTVLSENGYHEVYNYPLTSQKTEAVFGIDPDSAMRLLNPVAEHQDQMRRSLLAHFVQTLLENQKINLNFKVFEVGRTYYKSKSGEITEPIHLILGGSKKIESIGDSFFRLKSDLLKLFSRLQIPDIRWTPLTAEIEFYQHLKISAAVFSGQCKLGELYTFAPDFLDKRGLKGDVCIADLDFDELFSIKKQEFIYREPPKYPAVNFEVSLLMPEQAYFQEVQGIILGVDPLVKKVGFLDTFSPKEHVGKKSLSVSIEFRSMEKTLIPEDITSLQDKIVEVLANAGYHLRENREKA